MEFIGTAHARRSSSGASSRYAYGFALRISWENCEGTGVSTATQRMLPEASRSKTFFRPSTSIASVRASFIVSRSQWMIRDHNFALNIFLASECLGKDSRQQIIGTHALNLRRNFFSAHKTQQRKGAPGDPAPSGGEKRRGQYSLFQQGFDSGGL